MQQEIPTSNNKEAMVDVMMREVQPNPRASFPCMLHQCLTDIEELGKRDPAMKNLQQVISWCDQPEHAFRVYDRKKFEALVMPVWFVRLKYSSFIRELSTYGFKKVTVGGEKGGEF